MQLLKKDFGKEQYLTSC